MRPFAPAAGNPLEKFSPFITNHCFFYKSALNVLGHMPQFMSNTSMQHASSASRVPEPEPPPGIAANASTHRFHPSGHHLGFSSAGNAAHTRLLPGILE